MSEQDDEFDSESDEELEEKQADMRRRVSRIESKFDKFLLEIADDAVDDETMEKIIKMAERRLKKAGATMTYSSLRIFEAGFEFGMKSTMKLEGAIAPLMIGLKRLVKEKEPKVDITKSKPLSDYGSEPSL